MQQLGTGSCPGHSSLVGGPSLWPRSPGHREPPTLVLSARELAQSRLMGSLAAAGQPWPVEPPADQ